MTFNSKVIITIVAGVLAASLAVVFLGFLAIEIGAIPLVIIVFGILGAMLWDFFDTMRTTAKTADAQNGNNDGATPDA